jgi:signal transduction histidine kinase
MKKNQCWRKTYKLLEWKISFATACTLTLLIGLFYVYNIHTRVNDITNAIRPNLSYWIAVGDTFNIGRTSSLLKETSDINVSYEAPGLIVPGGNPSRILLHSAKSFFFVLEEKELRIQKVAKLRGFSDEDLGIIKVSSPLPIFPLLALLLLTLLLVKVLVYFFLKQVLHFSSGLIYLDKSENVHASELPLNEQVMNLDALLNKHQKERELVKRLIDKNSFAEQVVHDIRSPLSVLETALSLTDVKNSSVATLISLSFERIYGILDDLAMAPDDVQILKLDLCEVLLEIATEKKAQYGETSLQLIMPAKTYVGFAEKSLLIRILSNLINNAFESSPHEVEVKLRIFDSGEFNCISIKDTGLGMDEEVLDKATLKGFSTKLHGSGLGLFHASSVLRSWGGDLEIISVLGKGTEVVIKIPGIDLESRLIC